MPRSERQNPGVLGPARTWLRSLAGEGPAWSLRAWLAAGLLLHIPAALFADGYDFADQQFQYVDPAWHLATGGAWHRTWEWIDGVRSLVYPGLLAPVFRALTAIGLDDPMWTMRAVRAVHSLSALLPLWLFWKFVVEWRALAAPRIALLLFALSGLSISSHAQPSGPAFAATMAVAAALAMHGPRGYPALGGLCLGLAFCGRAQEAIFGPAMLGVLLWQRRFAGAAWFALGCLPGIALQGLVDLATSGRFLGTVFAYVETNVNGAAAKWRLQSWWFYLGAGVLPIAMLVPPFFRTATARLLEGARLLPGAFAAALLHLAVHSCIARKSLRFELGAFTMLLAVVAVGLATARPAQSPRKAIWHRRALLVVHGALFVHASFWFGNAGGVRMACWLHEHGANNGTIVAVDGDGTSMGGFFYLRPETDRVVPVARENLAARLASDPPRAGDLVVSSRNPLDLPSLAPGIEWAPALRFDGMFGLRDGERRFVYRVR